MDLIDVLVIGAGPAGLMAASEAARTGLSVVVAEAMPTIGRKFLMAGKSGLNLTKDEPIDDFLAAFPDPPSALEASLREFGPTDVKAWSESLGQTVFTGSSGRVFPDTMKASPLLRAWLSDLKRLEVDVRTRWKWLGGDTFDTPEGRQTLSSHTTIVAAGGASWSRLGSDGGWADLLETAELSPFRPANMGFEVAWSDHMAKHFGQPVKSVQLTAGDTSVRAEFIISQRGIEGGGVYAVSRPMREGETLILDLLPDLSLDDVRRRLEKTSKKQSLSNRLRKALKLDSVKIALLNEFGRPMPDDLAPLLKHLTVRHNGPRPWTRLSQLQVA